MEYKHIKFKSRYSGPKSKEFWEFINNLPDAQQDKFYSLGVVLQNLEASVLKELDDYISTVKQSINFKRK